MALKIIRGKNLPIGVDLGTSTVKMVQLRQTGEEYKLLAASSEAIPRLPQTDLTQRLDFLSGAIRTAIKTGAFVGRQCVLSIPSEATFVHHIKVPNVPAGGFHAALLHELQGKLPYPIEEGVVRHLVAGKVGGEGGDAKQEVIVISASRALIEAYLAMSRRASLDVLGINVEPCAIIECFARLFSRASDAERTILFIDMGAASTQVVFSHGEKLVFARNLSTGGDDLDSAVAEGVDIPLEQARDLRRDLSKHSKDGLAENELYDLLDAPLNGMAGELVKCLRYYESVFRNRPVERAIFLGGQAHDKRLCQLLAKRLNLPAQIGDPLVRVGRPRETGPSIPLDQREPQPDWAVAVGLCIGAVKAA